MKREFKFLSCIVCASLSITNAQNLTLHYNCPANYFEESFVIGNGKIGAILYCGTQEEKFFDRVSIDLGQTAPDIAALPTDEQLRLYTSEHQYNPDLEELYFQYGRYLLIASSRTPGVPANLQGLWNEQLLPPWSSNYTTNINLEENY